MANKPKDKVEVKLGREYSFGDKVTVNNLTLDDEELIVKQIAEGNSEKKVTIALTCGLTIEEAGALYSADGMKILNTINSFV
jgi:hypothetical protein